MARIEPQFTREEVNQAGRALLRVFSRENVLHEDWTAYERSLAIVNNWRGSHAYPLQTIYVNLRRTVRSYGGNPVVARRLKRLFSVAAKLHLQPNMKLSQMQDLGGCRAILNSVSDVRDVVSFYHSGSRVKHSLAKYDDYIACPKASGYRSAHLIFRYHSDIESNRIYDDLKIEMQVRSKYQHAWATAVETVGAFSGQALKSSLGSEHWQRFFALMSSVIALRERSPTVPDTPTRRSELIRELGSYADSLAVLERLRGYRAAIKHLRTQGRASYFLLQLNPSEGTLNVTGFSAGKFEEATRSYSEAERLARETRDADAVLVSLSSVNELSRAYPNYFADTRVFIQLLQQALGGRSRGIVVPTPPVELSQDGSPN